MVTIPWPVRRLVADVATPRGRVPYDAAEMARRTQEWLVPFVQGRRVAWLVGDDSPPIPELGGTQEGLVVRYGSGPTDEPSRWQADQVDVVVCWYLLEQAWDWRGALRDAFERLRVGGVFVSVTRTEPELFLNQPPAGPSSLRALAPAQLQNMLADVFGVVDVEGFIAQGGSSVTRRQAIDYYFSGPWAAPLRWVGRTVREPAAPPGDASRIVRDRMGLESASVLLSYCTKRSATPQPSPTFDAIAYWQERLAATTGIEGTGTAHMPQIWQEWMYRGKVRAYRRLLARTSVEIAGKHVLDFGCGTGYFEDVWERLGAASVTGVDVVAATVDSLAQRFPHRRYIAADLANAPSALDGLPPVDLATAIDVLYHIVDDDKLVRSMRALLDRTARGGHFMFTDTLQERRVAAHVQFRSLRQWEKLLDTLGWRIIDREPVFAVNNRRFPAMRRAPGPVGAVQHALDLPVLRLMPWTANNWVLLAARK